MIRIVAGIFAILAVGYWWAHPQLVFGADGDIAFQSNTTKLFKLTDAAVATGNGQWVSTEHFREALFECSGITTVTVQLQGSNAVAQPTNATAGYVMATWTNANGRFPIPLTYSSTTPTLTAGITAAAATADDVEMPRWIKTTVTAWTTGTTTCVMLARNAPSL